MILCRIIQDRINLCLNPVESHHFYFICAAACSVGQIFNVTRFSVFSLVRRTNYLKGSLQSNFPYRVDQITLSSGSEQNQISVRI